MAKIDIVKLGFTKSDDYESIGTLMGELEYDIGCIKYNLPLLYAELEKVREGLRLLEVTEDSVELKNKLMLVLQEITV